MSGFKLARTGFGGSRASVIRRGRFDGLGGFMICALSLFAPLQVGPKRLLEPCGFGCLLSVLRRGWHFGVAGYGLRTRFQQVEI